MANRRIEDLYLPFQPLVKKLLEKAIFGDWSAYITDGYRTFEEQTKLYNQGRTTAGAIVTQAKAGESYHNARRAVDISFKNKQGVGSYATELYDQLKNIKIPHLIWGGSPTWINFKDRPHFEYRFCLYHQKEHNYATSFQNNGECKDLIIQTKTSMDLQQNCLIQLLTPRLGFSWGIVLDDKIRLGEEKKILITWAMRNKDFNNKKVLDEEHAKKYSFALL